MDTEIGTKSGQRQKAIKKIRGNLGLVKSESKENLIRIKRPEFGSPQHTVATQLTKISQIIPRNEVPIEGSSSGMAALTQF